MFKKGDKIAIVACSNAKIKKDSSILELKNNLKELGLEIIESKYLYTSNSDINIAENKAAEIMGFYQDNDIKAIFDISGGDFANSLLPHLNYESIKNNYKPFFGYSDLTTIINALHTKTATVNYLYQPLNINKTIHEFKNSFLNNEKDIFELNYFSTFKGTVNAKVVGGNIRCFLKLAGTTYFPDTNNCILFLESLSGDYARIATYFEQLKQMNCFSNVKAVLLGKFTELQESYTPIEIIKFAESYIPKHIPIIKTENLGHHNESKCLKIGDTLTIKI